MVTSAVQPAGLPAAFDLWPEEALEAIHQASLQLLERAGVRVDSAAAREALLAAGATEVNDGRIALPRGLVTDSLAAAPREYSLVARDPQRTVPVDPEPGLTYIHNLGGAAAIVDPRTGATHRAQVADQVKLTRVMHHLRNQHILTSLVTPGDVPDPLEPLYSYLILAVESDKYLGGPGISFAAQAHALLDMAQALTGADGSNGHYPLDLAFSPVSPLILGGEVADALMSIARRGGVVCEILPCPAAATTAPAAVAAAVAQQNAEVLAGVVLLETVAPGTPVYYGPRLSSVDPRTGTVASGSPETSVIAATLLARRYGLACDCYGPCSDSKVVDAQFGYERAVNAVLGLMARPRFLSGIGEIQGGVATCTEILVIDDDVLMNAIHAVTPRPWDAEALDVDAMVEGVCSGRGFLGTKHTRRYIRTEYPVPRVGYRGGLGDWLESGRTSVVDAASERVATILEQSPLGLPADVGETMCRVIDEVARELGVGSWPDPRRLLTEA